MARLEMLTSYLDQYRDDSLILHFDEIESLCGTRLPRSARKTGSSYWSNNARNVYARHWLAAGFEVTFDGCDADEVHFVRAGPGTGATGRRRDRGEDAGTAPTPAGTEPEAGVVATEPQPRSPEETRRERTARLVRDLTESFAGGTMVLTGRGTAQLPGWEHLPDVRVAESLRAAGADPVWLRLVVTHGALIDRGRNDAGVWDAVQRLFEREPDSFDPWTVSGRGLARLASDLEEAGVTRRVADVAAWRLLAEAVAESAAVPRLCAVLFDAAGDAPELVAELADLAAGPHRPLARLAGDGVAPRWVRMLVVPGGASLGRLDQLPLVVDAAVRRATEYLGVTETGGVPAGEATARIREAWAEAIELSPPTGPAELAGTALALDQALWFQGQVGCRFCRRHVLQEPIGPACAACRLGS